MSLLKRVTGMLKPTASAAPALSAQGAFVANIIDPGLSWVGAVIPKLPSTNAARVMLAAIALQESGMTARAQYGGGPARGFWQFEKGGVSAVLSHSVVGPMARTLCGVAAVSALPQTVWAELEHNDRLAVAFARLLLRADPAPLPSNATDSWAYYQRNWRPGKPRPGDWPDNWEAALAAVAEATPTV